ncbi:MAG: regulatory protein RecX [Acidobacteriaceae bacterium]|nr:regulatory protein RecX [Acidobacteriaceae bacterium]
MQPRRAPRKLDSDALWEYALRILAQRPYSLAEIKQKLSRRSESPAALTTVIGKLCEYGLADDQKFAETFASARLQNQKFGSLRILRELRAKRVASGVAQTAVEKTFAGIDETELARRFLEKKFRGKNLSELLQQEQHLASAYRRLRTAGFSGRAALEALKTYSKRAEEFEEIPDQE